VRLSKVDRMDERQFRNGARTAKTVQIVTQQMPPLA
jgi:hypothetical protein